VNWPYNSDGNVLRRLAETGFDFTKSVEIDFNVDFETWPPKPEAMELLKQHHDNVELYEPEEDCDGYALFTINSVLTYQLVILTQENISALMKPFGGICESWGVYS
jgi:hypothetical protein